MLNREADIQAGFRDQWSVFPETSANAVIMGLLGIDPSTKKHLGKGTSFTIIPLSLIECFNSSPGLLTSFLDDHATQSAARRH